METFETAFDHESPEVLMVTPYGQFPINHFNSRIRFFEDAHTEMNHVEFFDDDGKLWAFKLNDEMVDLLMEKQFPYYVMPYVDVETMEWFVEVELKDMDLPPTV